MVDVITFVEFAAEALLATLVVTFFAVLDFGRVLIVVVAGIGFTTSDVESLEDGGGADESGEVFFGRPLFLAMVSVMMDAECGVSRIPGRAYKI